MEDSISDVEIEELGNSMKDELRNYLSLNIERHPPSVHLYSRPLEHGEEDGNGNGNEHGKHPLILHFVPATSLSLPARWREARLCAPQLRSLGSTGLLTPPPPALHRSAPLVCSTRLLVSLAATHSAPLVSSTRLPASLAVARSAPLDCSAHRRH